MQIVLSSTLNSAPKDLNFEFELFPYSGDPSAPGIDPVAADPLEAFKVPNGNDPNAAIAVGIVPAVDNSAAILDFMRRAYPAGGTPTAKALQQAFIYFPQAMDLANWLGQGLLKTHE